MVIKRHDRMEVTAEERALIERLRALDSYRRIKLIEIMLDEGDPDPDQAYFKVEAWQAAEREADEDIAAGRVSTFDTVDDMITHLRSLSHEIPDDGKV